MPTVLPEYIADIKTTSDNEQVILLNPAAAIQKAVAAFNAKRGTQYQFVTREVDVTVDDWKPEQLVTLRVQKAEDLGGKTPLYFVAEVNNWDTVYVTDGVLEMVKVEDYEYPQT